MEKRESGAGGATSGVQPPGKAAPLTRSHSQRLRPPRPGPTSLTPGAPPVPVAGPGSGGGPNLPRHLRGPARPGPGGRPPAARPSPRRAVPELSPVPSPGPGTHGAGAALLWSLPCPKAPAGLGRAAPLRPGVCRRACSQCRRKGGSSPRAHTRSHKAAGWALGGWVRDGEERLARLLAPCIPSFRHGAAWEWVLWQAASRATVAPGPTGVTGSRWGTARSGVGSVGTQLLALHHKGAVVEVVASPGRAPHLHPCLHFNWTPARDVGRIFISENKQTNKKSKKKLK